MLPIRADMESAPTETQKNGRKKGRVAKDSFAELTDTAGGSL